MSKSVNLEFNLELKNNDQTCISIIDALIENGWEYIRNDKITYLPVGDDDMFEWQTDPISRNDLNEIVKIKESKNEIIGLELYWLDSDIGIHILIESNKSFYLSLCINIKYINQELKLVDFNWYLQKIFPYINEKYHIVEYEFSCY